MYACVIVKQGNEIKIETKRKNKWYAPRVYFFLVCRWQQKCWIHTLKVRFRLDFISLSAHTAHRTYSVHCSWHWIHSKYIRTVPQLCRILDVCTEIAIFKIEIIDIGRITVLITSGIVHSKIFQQTNFWNMYFISNECFSIRKWFILR